jgi:hypothetical protein
VTPQEQAKEIIRKYYSVGAVECENCALIAVDLIQPLSPAHPRSSTNKEIYIVPHNVHKFLHLEPF